MPLIVCGVSVGCEVYLARIMSRNLKPYMVPSQHRYRFWRTVCQCYSGHLIITCLIIGLWGIVVSRHRVMPVNDHTVNTLIGVLCVASVLWWWINLGIAVAIRGGPSSIRYVVILLIPLIAAAGGLVVFIPLMLLCSVVF